MCLILLVYLLTWNFRDSRENEAIISQWKLEGWEVSFSGKQPVGLKHSCYRKIWKTCFSLQQSVFSNLLVYDKKYFQDTFIKVLSAFNCSIAENHLQ